MYHSSRRKKKRQTTTDLDLLKSSEQKVEIKRKRGDEVDDVDRCPKERQLVGAETSLTCLPTRSFTFHATGNEYQPKCGDALQLESKGINTGCAFIM